MTEIQRNCFAEGRGIFSEQTEAIIESEISVVEEASEPNIILNSTQVLDNEKGQVVKIARNEPFTQDRGYP